MARIIIPVNITFMGGGMPWTLVGEVSSDWTTANVASPYVASGYVEPDYFVDQEWTIVPDEEEVWTLVA